MGARTPPNRLIPGPDSKIGFKFFCIFENVPVACRSRFKLMQLCLKSFVVTEIDSKKGEEIIQTCVEMNISDVFVAVWPGT